MQVKKQQLESDMEQGTGSKLEKEYVKAAYCHPAYLTYIQSCCGCSVSRVRLFVTPWTAARWLPCPSPFPRLWSSPCPLSQWCHPIISSSVIPFSSCLQSFLASGTFLMSRLFASGGQSIGTSASASVLLMNIQGWLPLGLTGLISLQSKGPSRVFSNTTAQKHQFFRDRKSVV